MCRSTLVLAGFLALASCARLANSTPPIAADSTGPSAGHTTAGYESLYDFRNQPDGAYPNAVVLYANGLFYGTTAGGGSSHNGTVYSMTGDGAERLLHSFTGGADGEDPNAPLIANGGLFYGTSTGGGAYAQGTVFQIDPEGYERVIYSFTGGVDGGGPYSPLLLRKEKFYGTTYNGGIYGKGTVFAVDRSGNERVLYSFAGGGDGANPYAGVIAPTGTFYGVTYTGGAHNYGTVFMVTASGKERVLHSFPSSPKDGKNPRGGLTFLNGTLYGTACFGGPKGVGTVFKISLSGEEATIHDFKGEPDGANPIDTLLPFKGTLYGTTYAGGSQGGCPSFKGCGTVFEILPSGEERQLHAFGGPEQHDGQGPWGGVIRVGRNFYGTASLGGDGIGNFFRITP